MDTSEFLKIQTNLVDNISFEDIITTDGIKTIAGVDTAYWNNSGREYGVCCIVVIDVATCAPIEKKYAAGPIDMPYIPGFLAFRELPLFEKALSKLETKPDLFMFDGNGVLHPRNMGIATHASFLVNVPTIGVAKTFYKVADDADYVLPPNQVGASTRITYNGTELGLAVRTRLNTLPVFVSVGNRISLQTAKDIVMRVVTKDSRIPCPTRQADLYSHDCRNMLKTASD